MCTKHHALSLNQMTVKKTKQNMCFCGERCRKKDAYLKILSKYN